MFKGKDKCPKCGSSVEKNWSYCPICGWPLKEKYREERFFEDFFDFEGIARKIEREVEEFDKLFKVDFKSPKIKISHPSSFSAISITIHSGTGVKPKIEVRTYGDMKKYEPEIKKKLGIREIEEEEEESYEAPKFTEEPEAKIDDLGDRVLVEIKLPGVEKEEDIKIHMLEQSLEVRARTKDKLYFKLIPLKGKIVRKEFSKGKLVLEIKKSSIGSGKS
ncbi:MAG: zinc-ribbon domain-containing protein [Candidatus Aenigmatarchaeota archaeon]